MKVARPVRKMCRQVVRHLRGCDFNSARPFHEHSAAFTRTEHALRLYYAFSFAFAMHTASWAWERFSERDFVAPLWPFFSLLPNHLPVVLTLIFTAWIGGSLLSACRPDNRVFRISQALGMAYFAALTNSDGHYGHHLHALVWASLILAFVAPAKSKESSRGRLNRHRFMLGFWAAQFIICWFYFMTGLWKARSLIECAIWSEMNCELSEKVLTNIAAQELISYHKFAPLHQILFIVPWLGFFAYCGTIWLHLVSPYFPFRPRTHVLFGVLRVIFHLGTLLLFGVDFSAMTLVVISLFVWSPFPAREYSLLEQFSHIPPFRILRRLC